MRVIFSDKATEDLTLIGDYIAKDNPRRALDFVRSLRKKALKLGDMPRAFPLIPRYEHYGIRRFAYLDYLIFYCIEANYVSIIHILHGARDYEALLFPEHTPDD